MFNKRVFVVLLIIAIMFITISCKTSIKSSGGENTDEKLPKADHKLQSKKLENPNVSVLLWTELDNPELIAQEKKYTDAYNGEITHIQTLTKEAATKLATLVSAGDSPDVVVATPQHMPNYAIKNLLQPIEPYFDMKDPILNLNIMDQLKWNGRHYVVSQVSQTRIVFFNKNLFESNGIKTPFEHYKEGNWNWKTFREVAAPFVQDTNKDGNIDQWGFAVHHQDAKGMFVTMNGGHHVQYTDDGNIKLTLKEQKAIDALQFVQDLYYTDKSYAQGLENFFQGKAAMYIGQPKEVMPGGKFDGFKYEWGIAPFPTGPSAPKGISYGSTGAYGIPVGAKNPEGGAAYIRARLEYAKENRYNDYTNFYTEEQLKLIQELEEKTTLERYRGVANMEKVFDSLWKEITREGTPITTAVEKYIPMFEAEIDMALSAK